MALDTLNLRLNLSLASNISSGKEARQPCCSSAAARNDSHSCRHGSSLSSRAALSCRAARELLKGEAKKGLQGRARPQRQVVAAAAEVTYSSVSVSGRFEELKAKGEVALIPFIVAGDPDLATTEKLLLTLDANGADIIELGVPYSDPLADGPVIQAAATRALSGGTDLASVLALLTKVAPRLSAPIVLFTYYNPIMKKGLEEFFKITKEAGAAGLVVPDVPLEETGPLRNLASIYGLELVLLTTPTTPAERMAAIAEASQGFVYLVSLTGVTGARAAVEGRVQELLKTLKENTTKPIAVGFGISSPEHAVQVAEWGADGVIIGSKIVGLVSGAESPEKGLEAVAALMQSVKGALQKRAQPA